MKVYCPRAIGTRYIVPGPIGLLAGIETCQLMGCDRELHYSVCKTLLEVCWRWFAHIDY